MGAALSRTLLVHVLGESAKRFNEDDGPVPWKHEIGPPWKAAAAQSVAEAAPMQLFANKHLKRRVLLPHTAHTLGALLGGQGIGHASILCSGETDQGTRSA